MPMKSDAIRNLALVIIRKDNKVLASPGLDSIKGNNFFRLIGGGVDFGENSLMALKREIKEELDLELEKYRLLSVLENIFVYNGQNGHEVCFIYEADFKDKNNYQRESFVILDSDDQGQAIWVDINEINKKKLYPDGVGDLL